MKLDDLQRIKRWQAAHRDTHPVECRAWDAILTVWVMGWVGWLPACILDLAWALPLCIFAIFAPGIYVSWRLKAHVRRKLRCDWSIAAASRG